MVYVKRVECDDFFTPLNLLAFQLGYELRFDIDRVDFINKTRFLIRYNIQ